MDCTNIILVKAPSIKVAMAYFTHRPLATFIKNTKDGNKAFALFCDDLELKEPDNHFIKVMEALSRDRLLISVLQAKNYVLKDIKDIYTFEKSNAVYLDEKPSSIFDFDAIADNFNEWERIAALETKAPDIIVEAKKKKTPPNPSKPKVELKSEPLFTLGDDDIGDPDLLPARLAPRDVKLTTKARVIALEKELNYLYERTGKVIKMLASIKRDL